MAVATGVCAAGAAGAGMQASTASSAQTTRYVVDASGDGKIAAAQMHEATAPTPTNTTPHLSKSKMRFPTAFPKAPRKQAQPGCYDWGIPA